MLDPLFSALLARQRGPFNALYTQARPYALQLPPEQVYTFLRTTLQPVVLAAAPHLQTEALDALALELTVLGLDLIGKQMLGSGGRFELIASAWPRLFRAYAHLLAREPRRAVAALTNALVQLCVHPGARPEQWLGEIERLGAACADVDGLLRLGQVLGWRAGLAHYRAGALELIPALPEELQQELLGGEPLAAWQASPWHVPGRTRQIALQHVTGNFAGWGGRLHEPPSLAWDGDALLIADSQACWYVFADAFGESWIRRHEPIGRAGDAGPWQIDAQAQVSLAERQAHFPVLASWRQAAGCAHTLAVAMPDSFRVTLIG